MKLCLLTASLLLVGSWEAALAAATCVTSFGSCEVGGAPAAGSQCYCATPDGLVAGTIAGSGVGALPQFCCTPAGRFGPYPNSTVAVGQPCQAELPNRTTMAGQACF